MTDAIILVGLSGSGKSSVAAAVAQRLYRPLVDLDAEIEVREGAHPAELIGTRGEAAFRAIEAAEVERASAVPGAIIATGGGAVIDPLNRWKLWHAGTVVWLDAPDEVLAARLAAHHETRPLLSGDPAARLAVMRAQRERFYRAADLRVETAGSVADVVEAVIAGAASGLPASRRMFDAVVRRDHLMGPQTARVVLGNEFDAGTLADVLEPTSSGVPVVVADRRAARVLPELMAALPQERQILIASGERQKRLRTVDKLLETASAMGAERGDAWVGVGGGVTTDMVGAAAALYVRGVNFVAVTTTWLGMTDAAIGGKVAVDLSRAKNAAGAFWPPAAIVGDVATQRTLPRARRLDGMAESLKSGIIGDPALWDLVETRGKAALRDDEAARYAIIDRSVQLKLDVVDRDPFERGERRTLNLGHTLGHALEIESGYRLPHGKAVVLGTRAVAHVAVGRGAAPGLAERIDDVVRDLGYELTRDFDPTVVKAALTTDKKRVKGRQRWILPMDIGTVVDVDDVTEAELDAAIAHISAEGKR
jgi:3-dehydroquinate synthetase/shikimate kinase